MMVIYMVQEEEEEERTAQIDLAIDGWTNPEREFTIIQRRFLYSDSDLQWNV